MIKLLALSFLVALLGAAGAGAGPRESECPPIHPDDRKLKLRGMTLDQETDDPPPIQVRFGELLNERPDGTTDYVIHYASFWFYRDAILICTYSEVRNRRSINYAERKELRLSMPGILMRCEGTARYSKSPEATEWLRHRCIHDPDE
jgi:hypothetical protein